MRKVAVIGDRASVLAFRALGVEVFSPVTPDETRRLLDDLAQQDYGVIYLTERLAKDVIETVDRYKAQPVPAIIFIPDSQGTLHLGEAEISRNVEKAVGVDIFRK